MKKYTRPLIVGNWKSTPATCKEGEQFVKRLEKKIKAVRTDLPKKAYLLAVPEIFIPSLLPLASRGSIGAQTIHGIVVGQVTGATTAKQLRSSGASFAIIGHSEVRARGESVMERGTKVLQSLSCGLTSVVCFGEKTRDKEGEYLEWLENDVKQTLQNINRDLFKNLIVAYEPVWAIGGVSPATAAQCFEAVIAIRRALASLGGIDHAKKVKILYGGSVAKDTAVSFLVEGGVDGLLLGRASQDATSFFEILHVTAKY